MTTCTSRQDCPTTTEYSPVYHLSLWNHLLSISFAYIGNPVGYVPCDSTGTGMHHGHIKQFGIFLLLNCLMGSLLMTMLIMRTLASNNPTTNRREFTFSPDVLSVCAASRRTHAAAVPLFMTCMSSPELPCILAVTLDADVYP
ncbi:hypothetical protein BS17DRAFT_52617 [Gyrodon lividus]|nr:hypothetical protein BS17DRAFT_52617 [Gyrodon lividus]